MVATSDPKALLRRLLREPECEWLEFKLNNCSPDEIGRYVSACANASMLVGKDRAFVVWGVENKTRRRLGTTVRLLRLKKGNVNIANWLSQLLEPKLPLEFLDFEDGGLWFSILGIDPAYNRPVSFNGIEYLRVGENVKSLRDFPEHERSLWLATSRHKFEDAIAASHQSADDVVAKLDIDTYCNLAGEKRPPRAVEMLKAICSRGFAREDWEGGFGITNLGALLFARDMAEFPSVAGKAVRVIVYSGSDKTRSEGERDEAEGRLGYAIGFRNMIKYIMAKLPRNEVYEDGVRKIASSYSATAIREIVANALIHQDFTITGVGPVIEIYKDRVEITNAGNSLIEVDRMIDERRSRNENLAKAMRDLGFCEERGGGLDKAITEIEDMLLPAPYFWASAHSMRVVVPGPTPLAKLSRSEKVWACFCHCVVRWIRNDYMSNTSLRQRFSLRGEDYQVASAIIAAARKEGKIVPEDENQGKRIARYVPYWAR